MKAVIYKEYGSPEVLCLVDHAVEPINDSQIQIRVKYSTATAADMRLRASDYPYGFNFIGRIMMGIRRPKNQILGTEVSGVVEKVGAKVTDFKVGDRVFAHLGAKMGGYQEIVNIDTAMIPTVKIPDSVSLLEASPVGYAANTAFHFLTKSTSLKENSDVLVYGASGPIGSFAIQLARQKNCKITAVSRSENEQWLKSLGVTNLIDYRLAQVSNDQKFDYVIDCSGYNSLHSCLKNLKPGGQAITISANVPELFFGKLVSFFSSKKVISGIAKPSLENLNTIFVQLERKQIKVILDSVYDVDQIQEAHRKLDQRHRSGNIVIEFK